MPTTSWSSLLIALSMLALPVVAAAQPGTASGTLTIDGTTTTLSHAVRITKPNVFDDQSLDFIVVLSNQPLTVPQASDDAQLLSRAQSGLVTMAMRYDGRKGRGEKLFNATLRFKGEAEPVLLPDLFFKNTWKAGAGTLAMEKREFSGHTYEASVEFTVPVPKETTDAAATAPKTGAALPPPSKTDADRRAASALLIETLQEGDETRALEIVKLGIDPNAQDPEDEDRGDQLGRAHVPAARRQGTRLAQGGSDARAHSRHDSPQRSDGGVSRRRAASQGRRSEIVAPSCSSTVSRIRTGRSSRTSRSAKSARTSANRTASSGSH